MLILDENDDSFRFLARTNNTCEWISKLFLKASIVNVCVTVIVTSAMSVLSSYIKYGSFNTDHVHRTVPMR